MATAVAFAASYLLPQASASSLCSGYLSKDYVSKRNKIICLGSLMAFADNQVVIIFERKFSQCFNHYCLFNHPSSHAFGKSFFRPASVMQLCILVFLFYFFFPYSFCFLYYIL